MPDLTSPPFENSTSLPRRSPFSQMLSVSTAVSRAVLLGQDLETLFNDTAASIAEVLRCPYVMIQEYIASDSRLSYRGGSGWDQHPADEPVGAEAPMSPGIYCMRHGTPFTGRVNEPLWLAGKTFGEAGVTGAIAVLIPGGVCPFGVISLYHTGDAFSEDDAAWVQSLADIMGLAVRQRDMALALHEERTRLERMAATLGKQTVTPQQDSETRLQKLVDRLTEGLMTIDENGVHFNYKPESIAEQMRKSMGGLPDLASFVSAFDIYDGAGQVLALELWPHARLLAGEPLKNVDLQIRQRSTGWQRDFRYNGGTLEDPPGNAIYYMTISDITEQKNVERKLILSETKFRALVENSKDIFTISTSAGLQYVSDNILQILGYTPEEYRQLPLDHVVHPEDQPLRWNELSHPGDMIDLSFRSMHKDGSWRWMEGKGMNLLDIKGIHGYLFTTHDVTDRKIAEQKILGNEKIYHAIASSIPGSVICLLDRDYRYVLIEGDMMEQLGYDRTILLGQKAQDVLLPEVYARLADQLDRAFQGIAIHEEQTRNNIDLMIRYIPLHERTTDPIDLVMIAAFDITRVKEAQRQILRINEELEQRVVQRTKELIEKNQEMNAFNYTVAHDLRAPLRAINGYAQILIEDFAGQLGSDGKRVCGIIALQSRRMGQLIDDLLAFSKLTRVKLVFQELDMSAMVWDVYQQITTDDERKRIDFDAESLLTVTGDSTLMRQLWQNLIGNAVKFSQKKTRAAISISSTETDGHVTYVIRDNGAGFDMQYASRLFGIFERLHQYSEYEGTGVGLAIVERIVHLHDGTIWAESAPGEGAVFYFTCPAIRTQQSR